MPQKYKGIFGNTSDNNAQYGNTSERQTHPLIHRGILEIHQNSRLDLEIHQRDEGISGNTSDNIKKEVLDIHQNTRLNLI